MFIAILGILLTLLGMGNAQASEVQYVAPASEVVDEMEWAAFHADAFEEYSDEFTRLFNSYEVKFSKNGRTMIRQGNSGSFKFAKKGK